MITYRAIGLMSGTSLDGLDMVYCHFQLEDKQWKYELINYKSIDYDPDFRDRLKNAIDLSAEELLLFHHEYGRWLGNCAKEFISINNLQVDLVSSHGHTIFHQPERGFTFQLGSGHEMSQACDCKVICDFRSLDVTLGGQGAPLVPIGDMHLFEAYDYCLNLGGIANVSYSNTDNKRIAYDIVPVNMILNYLAAQLGLLYDKGGEAAKKGTIDYRLLDELNSLEFYKLPVPKSLGYEWFVKYLRPILDSTNISIEDKLSTAVYHIASQISSALNLGRGKEKKRLLITGGGAKNTFLVEIIKTNLEDKISIAIPTETIVDYKEAIIFAFMGVLRARGEVNCLQSVTGASRDTSSGIIYDI